MTRSAPAADGEWDEALATVRSGLDELDGLLAADDWSTRPTLRPVAVHAPLPPRLTAVAQSLVARLEAVQQRLADELADTRAALDDIEVRRSAARNYHQSAAFTSGRRSQDD